MDLLGHGVVESTELGRMIATWTADLDALSREQLIDGSEEVARTASASTAIRTGHGLCWHHPQLWGLLPEKTDPQPAVPAWPKFMAGCIRYRQSLDEQLPDAPRTDANYADSRERRPPMTRDWIFVPVIVQVLMTLLIYVRLIKVKIRELRAGKVNRDRLALHEDAWPESVLQINNNIRSQFELPVLFYMMTAILWALDAAHGLAHGGSFGVRPEPHRARLDSSRLELRAQPPAHVHRGLVGADVHGPAGAVGARPARRRPLKGTFTFARGAQK